MFKRKYINGLSVKLIYVNTCIATGQLVYETEQYLCWLNIKY